MKSTFSPLSQSLVAIVFLCVGWTQARAGEMPMVQNVNLSGDQLTWDAVEGATGYNIQLRFGYFDTVRDGRVYTVVEAGEYTVVAFDDNGNFSPAMFTSENRALFEDGPDNTPSGSILADDSAFFSTLCLDVDVGESCVASCPDFVGSNTGDLFVGSSTGGACSSSGTDFVSASITPDDYSCTVSSFTARVEAHVVCRTTPNTQ